MLAVGGSQQITNVKSISCGNTHTCILFNNGQVCSVGYNVDGQLGNKTYNDTSNSTPVYMKNPTNNENLTGVSAISCGGFHTLLLLLLSFYGLL